MQAIDAGENEHLVVGARQCSRKVFQNRVKQAAIVLSVPFLFLLSPSSFFFALPDNRLLLSSIVRFAMDFACGIDANLNHLAAFSGPFDDDGVRALRTHL